ncbi:MAG: toprim domain-containing protein [Patescibacteria group bacterium]
MDSLHRLEEIFSHFPGIGPRQARRFVYYLLNKSPSFIKEFTTLVDEVRKATSECPSCHRLFFEKKAGGGICSLCSDRNRDHTILMIVARDSDFETIEKSGAYQGLYFILGGAVPLMDKEPDKRIRLKSLLERVSSSPGIQEIILSLNTTPDGEHTATIVKDALLKIVAGGSVRITVLGRGLSTGAELEYVDRETIKNALRNRQ